MLQTCVYGAMQCRLPNWQLLMDMHDETAATGFPAPRVDGGSPNNSTNRQRSSASSQDDETYLSKPGRASKKSVSQLTDI